MRLYLITNLKRFKGAVHVVYGADNILAKADFTNTDLGPTQIEQMLKLISGNEQTVAVNFKNADTLIVQGDFDVSFDDFMREYPYKRNTHLARDYWPKMKKEDQVVAFYAAIDYRKFVEREQQRWKYTPKIAVTWLKDKEFLNNWKTL